MKLEDLLLKPLKFLDEPIERFHTKLTKKWEDTGRSRYSLAIMCSSLAIPGMFYDHMIVTYGEIAWGGLIGFDISQNGIGLADGEHMKGIKEKGNSFVVTSKYFFYGNQICNVVRTPLFYVGAFMAVKGSSNLVNYFTTSDASYLNEAIQDFGTVATTLGVASSIYIKQSDPKILDKQSSWSKFYDTFRTNNLQEIKIKSK